MACWRVKSEPSEYSIEDLEEEFEIVRDMARRSAAAG